MKFKIGDMVQVVKNDTYVPKLDCLVGLVGKIYSIYDLDEEYPYKVAFNSYNREQQEFLQYDIDNKHYYQEFSLEEMVLYKPKLKKFLQEYRKEINK